MQASDRVLAWRYGRALFLAASAKKEEGRVQSELSASYGAILNILPILRHPRVSAVDKKKQLADTLGPKVSPLTKRFLELLIDKKRFSLLPMVASDLGKLIAEKNSLVKAQVRCVKTPAAQAQQQLKERLEKFTGKNIELEIKEDPEIIGGLVVRLGDWVLDSSLRGQLRKMREALNGN